MVAIPYLLQGVGLGLGPGMDDMTKFLTFLRGQQVGKAVEDLNKPADVAAGEGDFSYTGPEPATQAVPTSTTPAGTGSTAPTTSAGTPYSAAPGTRTTATPYLDDPNLQKKIERDRSSELNFPLLTPARAKPIAGGPVALEPPDTVDQTVGYLRDKVKDIYRSVTQPTPVMTPANPPFPSTSIQSRTGGAPGTPMPASSVPAGQFGRGRRVPPGYAYDPRTGQYVPANIPPDSSQNYAPTSPQAIPTTPPAVGSAGEYVPTSPATLGQSSGTAFPAQPYVPGAHEYVPQIPP